nr:hypothetical protein Itr_chr08CG14670 [Ipomoea trifida]
MASLPFSGAGGGARVMMIGGDGRTPHQRSPTLLPEQTECSGAGQGGGQHGSFPSPVRRWRNASTVTSSPFEAASDEAKAATTSGDVLSPFSSGASLLDGGGKRASAVPSSGEQRQRHGQQRRATLLREVPPASMA